MPKETSIRVNNKRTARPVRINGGRQISAYREPKKRFFRRFLRVLFNPLTLSAAGLFVLAVSLTLTYFWFDYSEKIDSFLRGEVFTSTAGIYSAPKTLKVGEKISAADLKNYLISAGYVEKSQRADASRSRFFVANGSIAVEPGSSAIIDDAKVFPAVTVRFGKGGDSVETISDEGSGKQYTEVQMEPRILSSIAAEGDGKRRVVTFKDLPTNLIKAITATEDRAFFEHYGVNFRGIGRALWRRYDGENDDSPLANQGGSSITQQLVKNLLLNRDQTIERKLKEAFMSIILETRLSKEEIFTLYANQIYLGQRSGLAIYGVGQAANDYFGKDVSELTLTESAFIAGIIRSPNRYNPAKIPDKVRERRNQVLDSMVEAGAISNLEAANAKAEPLAVQKITSEKDLMGMPYFSQFAVEELPKLISDPEALQHLRVYTSIDPDLQKIAYDTVNKRLEKLEKAFSKKPKGSLQAALVAIKPKTGEIVAMVGGRDYLETQFNRATDAKRQPGSVFKPFVFAAAISTAYEPAARVLTAATIFKDEKKIFTYGQESYSPNNYGDTFSGKELTLRDALVKSKNVITVDLAMELNIGKVMNLAAKAGLPKVQKAYPSMALGTSEATPLEMATAYTVFANLGDRVMPMAISRVTSGEGKTVVAPSPDKKNVVHSDVAYIMDDMMKDVINRGTAGGAQAWGFKNVSGKNGIAGKTGTSRDGWFAGFTPEIVCVVYVGFDDGSDLGMKGSDSAMPIWADFMREALDRHPEWKGDWQKPDSVRTAEIDIRDGKLIREIDGDIGDPEEAVSESPPGLPDPESGTETPDANPEANPVEAPNVPPEFRRIELFIGGTIPTKALRSLDEQISDPEGVISGRVSPSPTPFTTWEQEGGSDPSGSSPKDKERSEEPEKIVNVWICELTGMKAGKFCPNKRRTEFKPGEEPTETCWYHIAPPK